MTDIVLFGDVEACVIAWLTEHLPYHGEDACVVGEVPEVRPAKFVRVAGTGGVALSVIHETARVTVEAWHQSATEAHDLAQLCRALIGAMAGETVTHTVGDRTADMFVYRVREVGRPAPFPDQMSGQPRCDFSSELAVRGRVMPLTPT